MGWAEAIRLTGILIADPSSMLAAAMQGWDHPISREAAALLDIFDLTHAAHSKKTPKPHPGRPTKPGGDKKHLGNSAGRTSQQVRAILAAARQGRAA